MCVVIKLDIDQGAEKTESRPGRGQSLPRPGFLPDSLQLGFLDAIEDPGVCLCAKDLGLLVTLVAEAAVKGVDSSMSEIVNYPKQRAQSAVRLFLLAKIARH